MPHHKNTTEPHQLHSVSLTYADEETLLAASPSSSFYHRFGYATSERSYWLWTQDGWVLFLAPQTGTALSQAAVHNDSVVTHNDAIVTI